MGTALQVAIGLYFVAWIWLFPRWLEGMRRRAHERRELDRFDARFGALPRAIGRYVVPTLGVALLVLAIVSRTAGD